MLNIKDKISAIILQALDDTIKMDGQPIPFDSFKKFLDRINELVDEAIKQLPWYLRKGGE